MHVLLTLLFAAAIQINTPMWQEGPPNLPHGTKIAVLEGDTKQPGIFTIRLKVPKGASMAAHTHPRAERVTVLSGRVVVSIGGRSTTFESGGFYVNPPDVPHSLRFEKESVLQLTCEGPWELRYVE